MDRVTMDDSTRNGQSKACYSTTAIICTRNRAQMLSRALRSLAQQSLPPTQFEIIVVDDGSEDETAEVCKMLRLKLPNLSYITTRSHVGLARARNIGIAAANGDYIVFTDDDCIAHSDWVERMRDALQREAIVGGAVAIPDRNYFQLCHNVSQFYRYLPSQDAGPKEFVVGANMGFRRSVLEELEGFRQATRYAEDIELICRARLKGYRPYFAPDAVVTHEPDRTDLLTILKYAADHGASSVVLRNRYRSLLHTPLVLRSALLLCVTAPLLALGVTAGIYLGNRGAAKLFMTAPVVYALKLAWCWGAACGLRNLTSV